MYIEENISVLKKIAIMCFEPTIVLGPEIDIKIDSTDRDNMSRITHSMEVEFRAFNQDWYKLLSIADNADNDVLNIRFTNEHTPGLPTYVQPTADVLTSGVVDAITYTNPEISELINTARADCDGLMASVVDQTITLAEAIARMKNNVLGYNAELRKIIKDPATSIEKAMDGFVKDYWYWTKVLDKPVSTYSSDKLFSPLAEINKCAMTEE